MRKIALFFKQKTQSLDGQGRLVLIPSALTYMSVAKNACQLIVASALALGAGKSMGQTANVLGQPTVSPLGGEYSILGAIPGDQVKPSISYPPSGGGAGVLAWQDNVVDKHGQGIGAVLLDSAGLTGGKTFRVNNTTPGDQLGPLATVLAGGNTLYVWQSKVAGSFDIYARLARTPAKPNAYGTAFFTADVRVNTYAKDEQINPAVAALPDGSAVMAWQSYGEDGSGWGVYARHVLASANKRFLQPKEFLVTQATQGNQRDPAIATLASGDYVIAWISEGEKTSTTADVYARVFSAGGAPVSEEIGVNTTAGVCGNPAVAPTGDGFTIVWNQQDATTPTNGLDIWGRSFTGAGMAQEPDFRINTHLYGDQYAPRIAAGPSGSLVVWTSLGQDGSREGVFGRFLAGGKQVSGGEFQINTTSISMQVQPAVVWNGVDRFVVVWSSFVGPTGMDLYGQAYSLNP